MRLFETVRDYHKTSAIIHVPYWYAVQVSDTTMMTIVEKAGIKIYNTLISTQKVIPAPRCSHPQLTKINDLLLIMWYNLMERA